jgi:hypothetical protein
MNGKCYLTGCDRPADLTLHNVPVCLQHGKELEAKLRILRDVMGVKRPKTKPAPVGRVRVEEELPDGTRRELRRIE